MKHDAGRQNVQSLGIEESDVRTEYWNGQAQRWRWIKPPLRPSPEDVAVFQRVADQRNTDLTTKPMRALMLGMTPEIAGMSWPDGADVVAVDQSPEMIAENWPGDTSGRRAVCADWFDAVPQSEPWDFVAADGSFNCLPSQQACEALLDLLRDHMRPGSRLVSRFFVSPKPRESPEAVMDRLHAGEFGNFPIFKFHLAMSTPSGEGQGVLLSDVWDVWKRQQITPSALHEATGWPLDEIRTIESYRDSHNRLWFPTLATVRKLCEQRFQLDELITPNYEMGECCPLFVLRRATSASVEH